MLRLAFMGSPDLGVPCLLALSRAPDMELVQVVTLGDRRRDRRGRPQPTAVGAAALEAGLALARWERGDRERILELLGGLRLDAIVVIAFARLLPPSLLALPRLGCLNLHASLLPWGRGASPIQAAVLAGLSASGWSAMIMDEGLDTGPLLARRELALAAHWNAGDLYEALKGCAPAFLLDTLRGWRDGRLTPEPQDESRATFTRKIPREAGALDWREDAERLDRQIKAYTPAPGCWCRLGDRRLGIRGARPAAAPAGSAPGRILDAGSRLLVACGRGALEILEVQPEGKRAMAAAEYLRGRPLAGAAGLENG